MLIMLSYTVLAFAVTRRTGVASLPASPQCFLCKAIIAKPSCLMPARSRWGRSHTPTGVGDPKCRLIKLLAEFVFAVNLLRSDAWIHHTLEGFTGIIFSFDSISPTPASNSASPEYRERIFLFFYIYIFFVQTQNMQQYCQRRLLMRVCDGSTVTVKRCSATHSPVSTVTKSLDIAFERARLFLHTFACCGRRNLGVTRRLLEGACWQFAFCDILGNFLMNDDLGSIRIGGTILSSW